MATPTRCMLADWLNERPPGDPDVRVVAAMCMFAMDVASGRLPGRYSDDLALLFARELLIDGLELGAYADEPDATLAAHFQVPAELIAARREDRLDDHRAGRCSWRGRPVGASADRARSTPRAGLKYSKFLE